jgi:hypothetical protein
VSGVGATITKTAPFATLVIDGHTFTSPADIGKRVLIKDEPSIGGFDAYNGVYTVTSVGSALAAWVLTRATDYDTSGTGTNEIDAGDFLYILGGTANANTSWVQQTPLPITVGTTGLAFIQFGAAAAGVTSFSAGTTGFTPSTATTGNVTLGGTLVVANGGTGVTTSTGTGSVVLSNSPALVTPALGVPASGDFSSGSFTWPTFNQNTTGTASNVTGLVAIANGGTNSTATATAGGSAYGTGTAFAFTAAGTAGQVLTSAGASAPVWSGISGGTF